MRIVLFSDLYSAKSMREAFSCYCCHLSGEPRFSCTERREGDFKICGMACGVYSARLIVCINDETAQDAYLFIDLIDNYENNYFLPELIGLIFNIFQQHKIM